MAAVCDVQAHHSKGLKAPKVRGYTGSPLARLGTLRLLEQKTILYAGFDLCISRYEGTPSIHWLWVDQ